MSNNSFELPEIVECEIRVGSKSAKYNVREMSAIESETVFGSLNIGTEEERRVASLKVSTKLIAMCVTRADGSGITMDEAEAMRLAVKRELSDAVLRVNGLTSSEGNASPPESESGT